MSTQPSRREQLALELKLITAELRFDEALRLQEAERDRERARDAERPRLGARWLDWAR